MENSSFLEIIFARKKHIMEWNSYIQNARGLNARSEE